MSWFPSRISSMTSGPLLFIVLSSIRSSRCAAAGSSLCRCGHHWPNKLISIRFPPSGVNSHHPYRLFTRVITARLFVPATMWDRPGSGGCGRHHD